MLTNCQKWLTTCHIWLTTCLQTVKKWWLIDIQSILLIDYRKNQYNRTIIGPLTTSNKFYLQREHTNRQTNRRQRCFFIYNKKNILIDKKRLMLFSRISFTYTQYKQTEPKYRAAPHRPPETIYLQTEHTHKRTNTRQHFPRQHILREGSRLVRGGSSRPIRRGHFPMYCY